MRTSAFSALALGFGLVTCQLSACSNSADDCNATASCGATSSVSGSAGTSGSDAGASDGGGANGGSPSTGGSVSGGSSGSSGTTGAGGEGGNNPGGCNGDVAADTACWATNDLGVFVSNENGSDTTGDGTKENPYATITTGIGASAGKNVYVCLGLTKLTYDEQIILSKTAYDVRIYGGFDCSDWSYSATRSAAVAPTATDANVALRIQSVSKAVYIENLRFTGADATGTGLAASSYGAIVTDSKSVTLKRVTLTAGAGADGANQAAATKGDDAPDVGDPQKGAAAVCSGTPADADGGKWPALLCGSRGGTGGGAALNANGLPGGSGIPGENVTPPNKENFGAGSSTPVVDGTDGTKGWPGNAGALGGAADEAGTFAVTGFTPSDGHDGIPGFPGQGGGGGGASKGTPACRGASGGAGGMGGCGGDLGKGGGGGGASVGLLSWASSVSLLECTVAAGAGGAGGVGGKAGDGGSGKDGASGGTGIPGTVGSGGRGGKGGNGGPGGSGSGGTGGPSISIVYSGTRPNYSTPDTTLSHAAKGAKGGAGGVVLTAKAPDGFDGAALDELEVK